MQDMTLSEVKPANSASAKMLSPKYNEILVCVRRLSNANVGLMFKTHGGLETSAHIRIVTFRPVYVGGELRFDMCSETIAPVPTALQSRRGLGPK